MMIDSDPSDVFEFPDRSSIAELLTDRATELGDATFVILPDDGIELTYRAVEERSRRLAWGLRGLGLEPGDRVALVLPNGEAAIVGWFACLLAGFVDTSVSPELTGEPLHYAVTKVGARAVLTDTDHLDDVLKAGEDVIVVVHGTGRGENDDVHAWDDVVAGAVEAALRPAPFTELASIRFTSGSTGMPKGIMMSPGHMRASAQMFNRITGLAEGETVYTPFPLHHVLASITGVLAALEAGASVSVARKFSASRFWTHVHDSGATVAQVLDPVVSILLKRDPAPDDTDNPVRCMYTAAGSYPDFEQRFGVELVRMFDMSELTVIARYRAGEAKRDGSCGRESELFHVATADEDDNIVATGETGEIVVRPKVPNVMYLGYYGDDEKTVAQWRNLWFHTGDMGHFDDDGYLYFTGRSADRIRHRGVNVSPDQIEAAARENDAVAEAAAVGVASDVSEDDIKICVRLAPGATVSEQELGEQLAARLSGHLRPRYIQFYDQLPKTDTEKIRKVVLRTEGENGLTPQTWDVENARWAAAVEAS